jgi:hypothetical protein
MVQVGSQKYEGDDIMFLFSYLVCSQIWLNLAVDGHHTWATSQKLTKTTL